MDGMSQPRMSMVDSCSERLIDARIAEISGLAIAEGKAAMPGRRRVDLGAVMRGIRHITSVPTVPRSAKAFVDWCGMHVCEIALAWFVGIQ